MMKKTKKIALSAILAAFGVIILYLGALVDVLDLSVAILASFLILFCTAELGYSTALSVWLVTSLLSLLLLPNKAPALLYTALFGYMPITKFLFERIGRRISWIPKLLLFNVASMAVGYFGWELLGFTTENRLGLDAGWMIAAYLLLANAVFIVCDILYTRLVWIYLKKYRNKIRKYLK